MALFEDYAGRIPQVNKALKEYGFAEGEEGLNQAHKLCQEAGIRYEDYIDLAHLLRELLMDPATALDGLSGVDLAAHA